MGGVDARQAGIIPTMIVIKHKTMDIKIIMISICILAASACNNQQNKEAEYTSSLVSNPITEKHIQKKIEESQQDDSKSCEDLVKKVLTTSKRYKQLTKELNKAIIQNGGQSFGIRLEGSPTPFKNKAWNYSETFDFTLYEVYSDRELNTSRFAFDPATKKLYEYDAVNDGLKPIDFDENLLEKYDALCK